MTEYKKSSVIMAKNLVFADGESDPKGRRPGMITIDADYEMGYLYVLALTSNTGAYLAHPDQYYSLDESEWMDSGLRKPSLVKLDKVHRVPCSGDIKAGFHPRVYKAIIQKLKEYMEKKPGCDEYYEKIKDRLK